MAPETSATDSELSRGGVSFWRRMLLLLAPGLVLYLLLLGVGIQRGLPVISVDDQMRHLYATRLFTTNAPETENIGDDLYYWPWGHLLFVRALIETIGSTAPEVESVVLGHALIGLLAVMVAGWVAWRLGANDRGVMLAAALFATMAYTPLFGISIMSDLPCALALMLGFGLHLRAFQQPGTLGYRALLGGDLCYALATTMRYEAWPLALIVGLASTWAHWSRRWETTGAFFGGTAIRGIIYAAFPVFWLLLSSARFDGDPFFFREIAASRVAGQFTAGEEGVFLFSVFWLTAPAAWVMVLSAALWRYVQRHDGRGWWAVRGGEPGWMGWPLLVVLAATWTIFVWWSGVSVGRASNLPDRLMYSPAALLMPLAGTLAGHWFSGGTKWLRVGLVSGLVIIGALVANHEIRSRIPHRTGMPNHIARVLQETQRRLGYDKRDHVLYIVDWAKYPAMMPIWIQARHYDMEWIGYTFELRNRMNIWNIDIDRTRFFITDNDRLARDAVLAYPWAPLYREGGRWFLLDLRGEEDFEFDRSLMASPDMEYLRVRGLRPRGNPGRDRRLATAWADASTTGAPTLRNADRVTTPGFFPPPPTSVTRP